MPYLEVGDLSIYYEEFGTGEPVLFLHSGYSRGILAFCGQIQPFYSAGFRCFYPDFRGHGRTRCKDLTWDSARIAEDMVAFLDGVGIKKANLVGYSTGGGVAYYMAARHPERVQSLIAIGNGGFADAAGSEDFEPEAMLARGEMDSIEKMKSLHSDAHGGNWEEYLHQEVKDWRAHPELTDEEWGKITMPMFLIAGEQDSFASAKNLGKIKEKCPQAEIWIVEGCGHRPHFPHERVKEVNERMLEFLECVEKSQCSKILMEIMPTDISDSRVLQLFSEHDDFMIDFLGEDKVYYTRYNRGENIKKVWVAYDGGLVAGCIAYRTKSDGIGEVKRLFIREGYRGRGLSKKLLCVLKDHAAAQGCEKLFLDTRITLEPAISLYRKFGFEVVFQQGLYVQLEMKL